MENVNIPPVFCGTDGFETKGRMENVNDVLERKLYEISTSIYIS